MPHRGHWNIFYGVQNSKTIKLLAKDDATYLSIPVQWWHFEIVCRSEIAYFWRFFFVAQILKVSRKQALLIWKILNLFVRIMGEMNEKPKPKSDWGCLVTTECWTSAIKIRRKIHFYAKVGSVCHIFYVHLSIFIHRHQFLYCKLCVCVCVPFSNEACTQCLYCGIFRCMNASSISTAISHSHFHFSLTHSSKNDINAVDMIFSHLLMWYLVLYYVPSSVGKCENHLFSSFHHGVSVVHICGVMETRGGRCACHIRWFYVVQSSG